ncbi:hypothetical protein BGZ52_000229, partial [Haplosporangium bisporale]
RFVSTTIPPSPDSKTVRFNASMARTPAKPSKAGPTRILVSPRMPVSVSTTPWQAIVAGPNPKYGSIFQACFRSSSVCPRRLTLTMCSNAMVGTPKSSEVNGKSFPSSLMDPSPTENRSSPTSACTQSPTSTRSPR